LSDQELQDKIELEITSLLNLTAPPTLMRFRKWNKAIPQFNVGYGEIRTAAAQFEKKYPGIHIKGNYLQGIAIPALLQDAVTLAATLKKK
jgi:oxygen-dependent protoporphyrinogen oxidase